MDKNLLFLLIILFLAVNLVPVMIFALSDRDPDPDETKARRVSQAVMLFALLGGAAGILLGLLAYPEQRTKRRIQTAAVGAAAWVTVLAAFIFIPKRSPVPAPVSPTEDHSEVLVSTRPPATSERSADLESDPASSEEIPSESVTRAPRETTYISLVAIGDMLMHTGVSARAFMPDGTVDYKFIFEPILEEVRAADIAVVNNEVPFGGNEYGLRNYPLFNVFTELGDEEVRAGFDVILCATNHVMDMTSAGLENTMNFWKKYPQIKVLGVHETQEDQDTLQIIERDGVKIALYNCTYGINSYGVPEDRPYMVDLMRVADQDRIRKYLERAEREAEFTIVFPHWGSEYHLTETSDQRYWATFFTQCGADLIIGTHPHVLQPVKTVNSSNGNSALCYYSLGNYISLQDETISVLGGMAKVTLVADNDGVRVYDHSTQYLVTHYGEDINYPYVLKLEDYTESLASQHGILLKGLPGDGYNVNFPFSVSTLHRVVDQIEGRIDDARVYPTPPPDPEPPAPEVTEPVPEENPEETESMSEDDSDTESESGESASESESEAMTTSRPTATESSAAPSETPGSSDETTTETPTETPTPEQTTKEPETATTAPTEPETTVPESETEQPTEEPTSATAAPTEPETMPPAPETEPPTDAPPAEGGDGTEP